MTAPPPRLASTRFTWRFRLVVVLPRAGGAWPSRSARDGIVGDTKLDLVVNPAAMLARVAAPVGPAGRVRAGAEPGVRLPLPDGTVLLARGPALDARRGWCSGCGGRCCSSWRSSAWSSSAGRWASARRRAGIVAGFAYALSPRILTHARSHLGRGLAQALAPWVLVPLVLGPRRGSPRRAALLSALAVAAVGGVNAAATFAVIPLGAVWLLTREPGTASSFADDVVARCSCSWARPGGWCRCSCSGGYSPPFLDYIETAAVTTVPDHALRRAARHVALGAVRRRHLAGRQRPRSRPATSR